MDLKCCQTFMSESKNIIYEWENYHNISDSTRINEKPDNVLWYLTASKILIINKITFCYLLDNY